MARKPKILVHIEGAPKGFPRPLRKNDQRTFTRAYSLKQGLFQIAAKLGLEQSGPLEITFRHYTIFWKARPEDPWTEIPPDYP